MIDLLLPLVEIGFVASLAYLAYLAFRVLVSTLARIWNRNRDIARARRTHELYTTFLAWLRTRGGLSERVREQDIYYLGSSVEEFLNVAQLDRSEFRDDLRYWHSRVTRQARGEASLEDLSRTSDDLLRTEEYQPLSLLFPLDFGIVTSVLVLAVLASGLLTSYLTRYQPRSSLPSNSPVYNARAEPNGGEPDMLLDGVPTRIFFNIGPRAPDNLIEHPELSERLRSEIQRIDDFDLFVTMTCAACTDTLPQTTPIRFLHDRQASTIAFFQIVPDSRRIVPEGTPAITFSIDRNGIEFDFLKLTVRVKRSDFSWSSTGNADTRCLPNFADPGEPQNDLVIRLAKTNDGLSVSFRAPNPALAALLGTAGAGPSSSPIFFKTGVRTLETITKNAADAYLRLKQLVDPHPTLGRALPDVGILDPHAQYVFDAKSKSNAVMTFYDLGVNLYDTLFYFDADGPLRDILDAIEKFGDEHPDLRILIYSDATYLPWQLLHRPKPGGEEPNPLQFWGLKYIIGVIPTDPERDCGRLPGALALSDASSVLYAHYWQAAGSVQPNLVAASDDTVSRLGAMFGQLLSNALGKGVRVVRTKPDFTNDITTAHTDLALIWSFTHGHSGAVVGEIGGNSVALPGIAGQRLDFSETQSITAREIKTATIPLTRLPYFSNRPFVFLNGCETGTQGVEGTTPESLPGVFIARGARGVIATEASVWELFGYNFSGVFLEKMAAGTDMGKAILATRREFLLKANNPLGLLYSSYGNPAVRFVRTASH